MLERRAWSVARRSPRNFIPGFRNSTASYTVSLLHPKVIRDLRLRAHGLKIVERPLANFLPLTDGRLPEGRRRTSARHAARVARFSPQDAEALPAYYAMLERVASAARTAARNAAQRRRRRARLLRGAEAGGKLQAPGMPRGATCSICSPRARAMCSIAGSSPTPIKAAFGFDAVVGNFASPYTPGSAYVLLHHVFGEVNGKRGQWGHAIGGMGAITQAMARGGARARRRDHDRRGRRACNRSRRRARRMALGDGTEDLRA